MDTAGSLETHDRSKAARRLLDVVGGSPKPHKKSPALALFDEILEKTLQAFAAESRAPAAASDERSRVIGGVVGWAPLLRALNVRPGRGLLGMSRNSHESVGVAEDYFQIPPEACTAMKVKLGAHHLEDLRRGGKKSGKVVHFGGDCEPDVMATELLRGDGYDTFIVEPLTAFKMPPHRRDAYVKFYANEAQRLAIWLTGKPVDEDKLSEELRARNAILAKFQEMMRLRLHNPFYVPLARVTQINQLSNNAKYRDAWFAAMNLLLDELRALANEPSPFHIPLLLVGVMHCEDLYHAIDETIGAVVAGFIPELYREDLPPLESLGDYLLQMQLRGELHDKCGSVVSLRRDRIERELKEFGARGVIVGGTTNCPYLAIAREMEYEYFTKKGVPVLVLDGTAHNDPATEEQKMRLRAFIEMML
jgi:benzoyl-CoA reductase/2-hydroxyglutaryl-CoA dehydratase subunit BcrC/BadD/HgdB